MEVKEEIKGYMLALTWNCRIKKKTRGKSMLKGNKHVHDTACISKYRDQISKQMSHHWMSRWNIYFQFNMKKESLRSEHWIYIFVVVGKKIFNGAQKGMQNKKKSLTSRCVCTNTQEKRATRIDIMKNSFNKCRDKKLSHCMRSSEVEKN